MTDDRRMTTDRFYGGVDGRLDILATLLNWIDETEPTEEAVHDWILAETRARSRDAVGKHLGFIAALELIESDDDTVTIGDAGARWLTDRDPRIFYETLTANVKGFETLLAAFSERGELTDDDLRDILVDAFDEAQMETAGPAARHREWLQALGFVARDDGVNTLTLTGAQLASEQRAEMGEPPDADDSAPDGVRSGGDTSPTRRTRAVTRVQRDQSLVDTLKSLYANRCQLCGDRRQYDQTTGFSHVHHLQPLGAPHDGPDVTANMLVVCPNHHADLDHGLVAVDPESLEITHAYADAETNATLTVVDEHELGAAYLRYHSQERVELGES
ncbi:HNH endonuclease [Halosegnis longus]|uniref:HNH endonuclease n=1 Tax=Halosegnis longus TaxID=2216012 RepID=UPI00129EAFBE|nr:HNH endonuclease [Halosegnis longus]